MDIPIGTPESLMTKGAQSPIDLTESPNGQKASMKPMLSSPLAEGKSSSIPTHVRVVDQFPIGTPMAGRSSSIAQTQLATQKRKAPALTIRSEAQELVDPLLQAQQRSIKSLLQPNDHREHYTTTRDNDNLSNGVKSAL
ncbi:hypothetical protein ACH5RR_015216 [Cinchona calisaya]|uniref:Uncharacterized protein n=1 Tax=Cinchona calisaya TaxID=153742 RepID=A0ABD2ZV68_9GENT